jgi:glycosyltransferase involved in cell wall biosynthesis
MRIALIASQYNLWAPVTPDSMLARDKMVAGGETAMIRMSQELQKHGNFVTVYAHTDKHRIFDGVEWVPMSKQGQFVDPPDPVDIAISYDVPSALACIQAKVRILENQTNDPVMEGLQVMPDAFVFKSEWHKDVVIRQRPTIDPCLSHVIGNGVDLALYDREVAKIPGRMIWTSSPDRGLHTALEIFGKVHEQRPDATFHIYYDFYKSFDGSKWAMQNVTENLWKAKRMMATMPGVTYMGPQPKDILSQAQLEAEILLFPEETPRPSEGFSIGTLEAMSARCVPIISNNDALGELWGPYCPMLPLPIDQTAWVSTVLEFLNDKDLRQKYINGFAPRVAEFTWESIGNQYDALCRKLLSEALCPHCGRAYSDLLE